MTDPDPTVFEPASETLEPGELPGQTGELLAETGERALSADEVPAEAAQAPESELAVEPAAVARAAQKLPSWVLQVPWVRRKFGLGDIAAALAKPVARAVKKVAPDTAAALGIDPDCEPCAERQRRLNALASFGPRRQK